MRVGLDDKIIDSITDVIKKYKVDKAVIFGSRARGDYKKTSDIDIAIYSKSMTYLDLNLLRDQLDQLYIIYKMDIVQMERLTNKKMIENVEKDGEVVFSGEEG
ncbi:MAG: nucleotidyltransferase domain-containing protein [Clostridia bacterium]|nr:nucleotidyltransferase domain-containing protein [Clostridia bacterium]MDD4049263.1 nucleotidyltransferase domain-containing protein [Clostridia bacterium]